MCIMLTDIPPPSPPPMTRCTMTLENSNAVVICMASTNSSVMGYLILLRFRDEHILNVKRSQDVMSPVVFEALKNGPHHVIVFPIMEESGIIGTSVLYSEMIEVMVVSTTSSPLTNVPTTSINSNLTLPPLNTTTSAGSTETAIIMIVVGR